ncbi:MAG: adenosylcobinamide-GDP ribazoletransferase, partial [Pyrinomonadaceae bacterium]|nr:adenosylcobinamide-GDP ribazoletransferase [Pyrinomonadaceae bacterium]
RWVHVAVAAFIALGAAGLIAGWSGILIWLGVSGAVLLVGRWIVGRLGGLSGDTYGALCEIMESGVLVAFGLRIWSGIG